jgi:hypothetical protein
MKKIILSFLIFIGLSSNAHGGDISDDIKQIQHELSSFVKEHTQYTKQDIKTLSAYTSYLSLLAIPITLCAYWLDCRCSDNAEKAIWFAQAAAQLPHMVANAALEEHNFDVGLLSTLVSDFNLTTSPIGLWLALSEPNQNKTRILQHVIVATSDVSLSLLSYYFNSVIKKMLPRKEQELQRRILRILSYTCIKGVMGNLAHKKAHFRPQELTEDIVKQFGLVAIAEVLGALVARNMALSPEAISTSTEATATTQNVNESQISETLEPVTV